MTKFYILPNLLWVLHRNTWLSMLQLFKNSMKHLLFNRPNSIIVTRYISVVILIIVYLDLDGWTRTETGTKRAARMYASEMLTRERANSTRDWNISVIAFNNCQSKYSFLSSDVFLQGRDWNITLLHKNHKSSFEYHFFFQGYCDLVYKHSDDFSENKKIFYVISWVTYQPIKQHAT